MVDLLAAVVGVKAAQVEKKAVKQLVQHRQQKVFADTFDGGDGLELDERAVRIDEIDVLDAVQFALVDAIDAQKIGLTIRIGTAALANGVSGGGGLVRHGAAAALLNGTMARFVEMRHLDPGNALTA